MEIRREIARIVEQHLDEILERTIEEYRRAIPSLAKADAARLQRVREATRRATIAFLAIFADPDTPARPILDEARRATVDRAGEEYEQDEIQMMIRIAADVMFDSARAHVQAELGSDATREAATGAALGAFLDELQRIGYRTPAGSDVLDQLLSDAETEEPDVR